MKKLLPIVVGLSLPFAVVSCGDKPEKETGKPEASATETKKADTHESLNEEFIVAFKAMADSAGEGATAENIAKAVKDCAAKMGDIEARLKKLGKPSEEVQKQIKEKMDGLEQEMGEKMGNFMMSVGKMSMDEEKGKVIAPAMEEFEKAMKSFGEMIDEYFPKGDK